MSMYTPKWQSAKMQRGPNYRERQALERQRARAEKEMAASYYVNNVDEQIQLLENSGMDSAGEAQFRVMMIEFFAQEAEKDEKVPRGAVKDLEKAAAQARRFFKEYHGAWDNNNKQYSEMMQSFNEGNWADVGLIDAPGPITP